MSSQRTKSSSQLEGEIIELCRAAGYRPVEAFALLLETACPVAVSLTVDNVAAKRLIVEAVDVWFRTSGAEAERHFGAIRPKVKP